MLKKETLKIVAGVLIFGAIYAAAYCVLDAGLKKNDKMVETEIKRNQGIYRDINKPTNAEHINKATQMYETNNQGTIDNKF